MNGKNFISVIIPVYNSERYLSACIESIINQTYENFEVILVDDGSTDKSNDICKDFANKYENIRLIEKENGGVSFSRLAGLKAAQGNYIVFVDNDDIVLPDYLKHLMYLVEDGTEVAKISNVFVLSEQMEDYIPKMHQKKETVQCFSGIEASDNLMFFGDYNISRPLWGTIYQKDFLDSIHLEEYQEKIPYLFFEDVFAMKIILINAKKVKYSNQILYIQRATFDSLSTIKHLTNYHIDAIEAYHEQYEYLKKRGARRGLEHNLDNYEKCLVRMWYKLVHDQNREKEKNDIIDNINYYYRYYYNQFMKLPVNKLRKINMMLFKNCRKIWNIVIGNLYFSIWSEIKRKKYIKIVKGRKCDEDN